MTTHSPRGRLAALALALGSLFAAGSASAGNVAYAIGTDNWTFTGTTQVDVPNTKTNVFAKPANTRLVITFSAECGVTGGTTSSWLDVDIVLLDATTGAVVYTAAPTAGSQDAFCSSSGTSDYSWGAHSVQALIPYSFAAGNYRAAVKARLNYGATEGWLGERMISVMQ